MNTLTQRFRSRSSELSQINWIVRVQNTFSVNWSCMSKPSRSSQSSKSLTQRHVLQSQLCYPAVTSSGTYLSVFRKPPCCAWMCWVTQRASEEKKWSRWSPQMSCEWNVWHEKKKEWQWVSRLELSFCTLLAPNFDTPSTKTNVIFEK